MSAARNLLAPPGDETALRMSVQMMQPRSVRPAIGAASGGSEFAGAGASPQPHMQPEKAQSTRVQVSELLGWVVACDLLLLVP